VIAFVRRAQDPPDCLVCACNFTPVPRYGYRIGVPTAGWYRELLNSDAGVYGGSNVGNGGGVQADNWPSHGFQYSVVLTLPPLAVVFLKPS
jgi:1,4-alpha-glucan branching enzyme